MGADRHSASGNEGIDPVDRRSFDREFTIALWIKVPRDRAGMAGGLAAKFDSVTRRGFTLNAISSSGGYCGPGDEVRISFGVDDGSEPTWTDCGRPLASSNYVSNSLTVFDGSLYAATSDAPREPDRGHVYRYLGEREWQDCGKVPREGASGIGPMIVHRDALYAAAWNYDWTRVHQQALEPCHVYRFVDSGRWEDCGQPGKSKRIFGLGSYKGVLYAAGDDFTVQAYRGDASWEQVAALPTYGHPLTAGAGAMYLGTLDPAGVWTFDDMRWRDIGNPLDDPQRCSQVHSFAWYHGELHAGTWPLGRVARWTPARGGWTDLGRLGDSTEINGLAVYNGKLYGGSIPRAEVYRYERPQSWTRIRRFFGPPGWRPVLVRNMEKPPNGDRRMREWTRVTSLTEHDGRLFASVGSCTSAAIDAPPDVRGTVHAMSAGAVATTSHSLEPGWHHVAAVRKGSRLEVFVDGKSAASSFGRVTGSTASAASFSAGKSLPGHFAGELRAAQVWESALDARRIAALAVLAPS